MRNVHGAAAIAAGVSYELGSVPDRQEYLQAAAQTLMSLIGGDVVGWNFVDLPERQAELVYYPCDPLRDRSLAQKPAEAADDHPRVVSYLRPRAAVVPRRLSDLCSRRELIATRTLSATGEY